MIVIKKLGSIVILVLMITSGLTVFKNTGADSTSAITWNTASLTLPKAIEGCSTVFYGNTIYVVGGEDGTANGVQNTIYYSQVDSNGQPTVWSTGYMPNWPSDSRLYGPPEGRFSRTNLATVVNGYLYIVGGAASYPWKDASHTSYTVNDQNRNTVWYAKINNDGSLGTWKAGTPLPYGLQDQVVASWEGHIYVVRGWAENSESLVADVYSDGSISSWRSGPDLSPVWHGQAGAIYNGYIYTSGGHIDPTIYQDIYYAKLDCSGNIGTWQTSSLPKPLEFHAFVPLNGRVYVIGGNDEWNPTDYLSSVYSAAINSDGSLGGWTTENSLPVPRAEAGAATYNGRIYIVGGSSDPGTPTNTIYISSQTSGNLEIWSVNVIPSANVDFFVNYNIIISIRNLGTVPQTTTISINESGAKTQYGDSNTQLQSKTIQVPPGKIVAVSFVFSHSWYWIETPPGGSPKDSSSVIYDVISTISTLGKITQLDTITSVPFSLLEAVVTYLQGNWSNLYTYTISTDFVGSWTQTVTVNVPINKKIALGNSILWDSSSGLFFGLAIGSFAGGPTAAASIPLIVAWLATRYAATQTLNAAVDPDLNYKETVVAIPITISQVESLPDGLGKQMAETSIQLLVDTTAMEKAYSKYGGALISGDSGWAQTQLLAAESFKTLVEKDRIALKYLIDIQGLNNHLPKTNDDLNNIKNIATTNGLPSIVYDIGQQMGVTINDIDTTKTLFLNTPNSILLNNNFAVLDSLKDPTATEPTTKSALVFMDPIVQTKSNGQFITAIITVPISRSYETIQPSTISIVSLNGLILSKPLINLAKPVDVILKKCGIEVLIIKFDKSDFINTVNSLKIKGITTVTIKGMTNSYNMFCGNTKVFIK